MRSEGHTGTAESSENVFPAGFLVGSKYEVLRTLGTGGMGTVVAARDTMLDQVVAVKIMHEEMAKDADHVQRFIREGRAAALLKSDHSTRIYDVGRMPSGAPFLVMEYLDGEDLESIQAQRPFSVDEVVDFTLQACVAIAEAHKVGIVHRDLKPQNLFLAKRHDGSSRIKVLDFGLAKDLERRTTNDQLTTENMVLGSPHYMSPEQIRAPNQVDQRTDIWSLGATLYHLFIGEPPWSSATFYGLVARIMADPVPSIRAKRMDVPEPLETLIMKCLERDIDKRIASIEQLASGLALARRRTSSMNSVKTVPRAMPLPAMQSPASSAPHPTDDSSTLPLGTFVERQRTVTMQEFARLQAQHAQQQQQQQQPQQQQHPPPPSIGPSMPQTPIMLNAPTPPIPRGGAVTGPHMPMPVEPDDRPLWPFIAGGVMLAVIVVSLWFIFARTH